MTNANASSKHNAPVGASSGALADVPENIGPHEGRELALMFSGQKPLAMFCDVVPSSYTWPDADFEPYVLSGAIVKKEFLSETPDGNHTLRYVYFALPDEAWRIDEAHAVNMRHYDVWCAESKADCMQLGRLLGYSEKEIQAFVDWTCETMKVSQE